MWIETTIKLRYSLSMTSIKKIRDKYVKLIDSAGIDEAITKLHGEMGKLEPHTFDGGFNADRFEELQALRDLSRELWTMRLAQRVAQK